MVLPACATLCGPSLVRWAVRGMALAACALGWQSAAALTALEDDELAAVRGAGVAFNIRNYALSGDLSLTYVGRPTSPGGPSQFLRLGNLSLSRSDDPAATFSDPYTLSVLARPGLPDVVQWTEPRNANGLLKWQFAADWTVGTQDRTLDGGAWLVQDLQSYGGRMSVTSPTDADVQGVVFGSVVHADIGAVVLRPRGRADASQEMRIAGLHVGGADGVSPWVLADVTSQPGIFNAITEGARSYLHLGIAWPTNPALEVPAGRVVVDALTFRNDAPTYVDPLTQLPTAQLSLGASRIASVQVQYLDVKLHAGP